MQNELLEAKVKKMTTSYEELKKESEAKIIEMTTKYEELKKENDALKQEYSSGCAPIKKLSEENHHLKKIDK